MLTKGAEAGHRAQKSRHGDASDRNKHQSDCKRKKENRDEENETKNKHGQVGRNLAKLYEHNRLCPTVCGEVFLNQIANGENDSPYKNGKKQEQKRTDVQKPVALKCNVYDLRRKEEDCECRDNKIREYGCENERQFFHVRLLY